ncbi:MAG: restriction endonuclease subunit S [Halobacteriovoraceae bacterium]|nr:restriction endonuclease subunit S [Halobacteriovoraceae bacterium]
MIDIRPDHLEIVISILKEYLPRGHKVWAYGGRARWETEDSSDLDLALEGKGKIKPEILEKIQEAFEDSDLPYKVDVVDLAVVSDKFKQVIGKEKVLIDLTKSDNLTNSTRDKEKKVYRKGWREVRLGDIVKSNTRNIDKSYPHEEILYLDTGSITEGKVSELQPFKIERAPSRAKRMVKDKDIIYSTVRPSQRHYGFIKKPQKNLVVSTGFSVIETNNKFADPLFTYFLLSSNSVVKKLNVIAEGSTSTYPSLRPEDIENLKVLLPTLSEQKNIAEILGSLDDKIDLLHRQNKVLEEMAQAIFKSWFVDFDPVHAKKLALEKGLTKKQAECAAMAVISGVCGPKEFAEKFKEMDGRFKQKLSKMSNKEQEELAYTASLFPSGFEDSELGKIPKGFKALPIYELIKVVAGGTPKRSEASYWGGSIPWFSVKDIPFNGITVFDTEEYITELGLKKSSTKIQKKGSTIISARGTVGKLALVMKEMAMNQSCYGIEPIKGLGSVYNYFNVSQIIESLKRSAHGAVFDTITHDTFKSCKVSFSDFDLAQKYENVSGKIIEKIFINQKEIIVRSKLRDTLLPKLLAGEIDLSNINAGKE